MPTTKRLPLSAAQSALWYAQQLDPANPVFNCAHYVEIDGPLDVRVFEAALRQAIAEADSLNVEFVTDGIDVHQVRRPGQDWSLHISDSSDALTWMRADLATPPPFGRVTYAKDLFRQALFRVGDERFLWYQRIHHLLVDGFGFSSLERRVADIYTRLVAGKPVNRVFGSLKALLDAESFYAGSAPYNADRDYWAGVFADDPDVVSLSEKPARSAHTFTRISGELSTEASGRLSTVASAAHASWPELVMAATAAYLHAMTGKIDIVLGIPIMGRLGTAAANVPATVVNVLPLRLAVRPSDTVGELVRQVSERLRRLRTHQRYRYEQLQRDLGRLGERRLFGPQVNIKPFDSRLSFAGLPGKAHYLAAGPVDDLEVVVYAQAGSKRLGVDVDGNPEIYDEAALAGHHRRFVALLESLDTLDTPLAALPVATPAERQLVVRDWNATDHPVPDCTLTDLLEHFDPQWTAVEFGETVVTYEELHARANALAADLVGRGIGPGDLVAVGHDRSVELMVALLAVLKAGAAYLPLDPSYPADRIASMLADARPVHILRDGTYERKAGRAPTRTRELRPDDPAYVIYTSGSTGKPKGVVVPHRGIVNRLLWMADYFGIDRSDRVLQKTPIGFDVSVWELFLPLITGAQLVLAEPGGHRDPTYLARTIRDRRITTVHFVPSMLRILLAEPEPLGHTELRRVICSGEELTADLLGTLDVPIFNLYGPTEASVDVTAAKSSTAIGKPVWNTRMYVLGPGDQPLPPGATGQLYIAGIQLATGYLGRPELTAERFRPDPFGPAGARMYATGDLARWRPDGLLEFRGRIDDQVKIRGQRVELGEVSAVLASHPDVRQATAVVRDGGLVAYAVSTQNPVRLRDFLAGKLAVVPSDVVTLTEFPLTRSGKLDRKSLPAPARTTKKNAPRSVRETQLCALFAEVLDLPAVGIHDNFFDLGGHSLLAAQLAGRVRTVTGVDCTIGSIFAAPTVAKLADTGDDRGLDVLLPLREGKPALFCVHPAGGLSWCYSGLLSYVDVPVYGVQARRNPLASSIAEMAADYVSEIRKVQPHGPYRLLGWSVGGVIAHEMAVQLKDVGLLCLLDAYPSDQWRDLPPPDDFEEALLNMTGGIGLDEETLRQFPAVIANNARLMRGHRHRVFPGDMVFVSATAPRPENWLDLAGWKPYVGGVIENHDLPCTHPELVRPANLARIAGIITPQLR